MSSLRALAKKGKCFTLKGADADYEKMAIQASRNPDVVGVNATSVADDVAVTTIDGRWLIPDASLKISMPATPCYEQMWFEFTFNADRWAVITQRQKGTHLSKIRGQCDRSREGVEDEWTVMSIIGIPADGQLLMIPMRNLAYLGADGRVNATGLYSDDVVYRDPKISRMLSGQATLGLFVASHACARLNCRNVELKLISEPKIRPHAARKIIPACVWHEIIVTSVPKIQHGGRDVLGTPDDAKRQYWIRGHYADYTKGPGLFGNAKLRCTFWIPEYKRGNEELGFVIPEYTIQ